MTRASGLAIVLIAVILGVAGVPRFVLQAYVDAVYPAVQAWLTPASNAVAVPLFDLVLLGAALAGVVGVFAAMRRSFRRRSMRPLLHLAAMALVTAATCYLWFLAAWGLNYRRAGVESALADFSSERATPARVRRLAEVAVARTNALHAPAHAHGFPAVDEAPAALASSLHTVERRLGRPRATAPARPKQPLTTPYFRAVGVSGMLAPLFLETYVNPDLTGPERPYVLAHEWAHLSGWAPEEDASFVGLLTALGADVPAQYSAWLHLATEAGGRLHPVTRDVVLGALEAGPRADLAAIAERLRLRVPWLDRASWVAYDHAIRSQGAVEGVAGYGRVIELVLGSNLLAADGVTP